MFLSKEYKRQCYGKFFMVFFCQFAANITLALNFKGHAVLFIFTLQGFSEAFQKLKSQILNFSGNFSPC